MNLVQMQWPDVVWVLISDSTQSPLRLCPTSIARKCDTRHLNTLETYSVSRTDIVIRRKTSGCKDMNSENPSQEVGWCVVTVGGPSHYKAKVCSKDGCSKIAKGALGFCIGHGGGKRCHHAGCSKSADGKTDFCKAHGGGRRCQHKPCSKAAQGTTDFCIAHGGGKRCKRDGCVRSAQGKTLLCKAHGGGNRCRYVGCDKSAQDRGGYCGAHGGGNRCQHVDCENLAKGNTGMCLSHGGGKRCLESGCNKLALGRNGRCIAHGGGRQCKHAECTKSSERGDQLCMTHGGGRRCKHTGCNTLAQDVVGFCKYHGVAKRCLFAGCRSSASGGQDFCEGHLMEIRCQRLKDGDSRTSSCIASDSGLLHSKTEYGLSENQYPFMSASQSSVQAGIQGDACPVQPQTPKIPVDLSSVLHHGCVAPLDAHGGQQVPYSSNNNVMWVTLESGPVSSEVNTVRTSCASLASSTDGRSDGAGVAGTQPIAVHPYLTGTRPDHGRRATDNCTQMSSVDKYCVALGEAMKQFAMPNAQTADTSGAGFRSCHAYDWARHFPQQGGPGVPANGFGYVDAQFPICVALPSLPLLQPHASLARLPREPQAVQAVPAMTRHCQELGCVESVQGSSLFCQSHGVVTKFSFEQERWSSPAIHGLMPHPEYGWGRRRCQAAGCTAEAQGDTALCTVHGGGRRCHQGGCPKPAQGEARFCKTHGRVGGDETNHTDNQILVFDLGQMRGQSGWRGATE